MTSANPQVQVLHEAFCTIAGRQTPLLYHFERGWLIAANEDLTADDVRRIYKARQQAVKCGKRYEACLLLRNWIGDEDIVADLLDEAHMLRAKLRIKTVDKGKAEVLRATGRPVEAPEQQAKLVRNLPLMEALRKATQ